MKAPTRVIGGLLLIVALSGCTIQVAPTKDAAVAAPGPAPALEADEPWFDEQEFLELSQEVFPGYQTREELLDFADKACSTIEDYNGDVPAVIEELATGFLTDEVSFNDSDRFMRKTGRIMAIAVAFKCPEYAKS